MTSKVSVWIGMLLVLVCVFWHTLRVDGVAPASFFVEMVEVFDEDSTESIDDGASPSGVGILFAGSVLSPFHTITLTEAFFYNNPIICAQDKPPRGLL